MKRDSRGRVRFAHEGYRFELTKSGLNAIEREGSGPFSYQGRLPMYEPLSDLTGRLLSTEEGRTKLAEAINALHATEFTTAIHIPENMRAV